MREQDTRLIPWAQWEVDWAHRRPAEHRTPLPAAGDEVRYRHDGWGPVWPAEVHWVQPFDDLDDPHLWNIELDGVGGAVLVDGRTVIQQRFDPWPRLHLRVDAPGLTHLLVDTREARLRGSPGWLPLDWETRYRPMPEFTIVTAH